MPIMCEGNSFSNGNRKPVTLVKIVNRRKTAVRPGVGFERSIANMTIRPEAIAIRLMMTWRVVKADRLIPSTMARSRFVQRCYAFDYTALRHKLL
jgi:hypothetical protein